VSGDKPPAAGDGVTQAADMRPGTRRSWLDLPRQASRRPIGMTS